MVIDFLIVVLPAWTGLVVFSLVALTDSAERYREEGTWPPSP